MENNVPKVSVIIPVYNTENYLKKCLDSVCNQTLKDIEIICINDCSPDSCLEILKEYASKDERIKIIDFKENKGAACARNAGIDAAQGEYLGFVDSDDFVDLDFYEKLYYKALETNADIVKASYKYVQNNHIENILNEKILENKNIFSFEYCSAIFKKELLKTNGIYFPILRDMEDPVFAYTAANCANKIEILENTHINIVKRSDSQSACIPNNNQVNDKITGLKKLIEVTNLYNTPNVASGYVLALWFKVCLDSCERASLHTRIYFIENFIHLYKQISNKEPFLYYLKIINPILSYAVKEEDVLKILNYNIEQLLEKQVAKIAENKQTIKVLEGYAKRLVEKYAVKDLKHSTGDETYIISVVNNYDLYSKCIKDNPFVKYISNIHLVDINNLQENFSIPMRYNSFLKSYDYNNNAWFIFCHCDWQPLEDMNYVLKNLDKDAIYGPIGSKAEIFNNRIYKLQTGFCFEKRRDGSDLRALGAHKKSLEESDTFDCQALIVHSSLIKKYKLQFDENLDWDLYVEDFCINAKLKYGIKSYAVSFNSCHWSGYHTTPKSYYRNLEYINKKYPNYTFSGTVSLIGNKNIEQATQKDILFYRLRKRNEQARTRTIKTIQTI